MGTVTFSPGLQGCARRTREPRSGVQSRWRSGCQKPMKSGLPSGCLGAGAFKSGSPLASRGTFGVGYFTHWPKTCEDVSANTLTTTAPRAHAPMRNCPTPYVTMPTLYEYAHTSPNFLTCQGS